MKDRYDFTLNLIREAGELVLESRSKYVNVSSKNNDPRDLVTNVDIEVGEFVSQKIRESFPGEEIRSEESGTDVAGKSFWTIDPIDGTSNFARGIPHFAVVISYVEDGEPIVGAIYNPVTKELFSFDKNKGSFLNGSEIRTSKIEGLKDAYILLHIGRKEEVREWGIRLQEKFLSSAKKNINLGSSALDLAFLASGRVDAVIYGTLTTIDIAVATALVRRAGGEVYFINGSQVNISTEPQQIIATATKGLFEEISKI